VQAFTASGNAAEAARAAGYRGNPKVVSEVARKLLKRPDVQAMIEAIRTTKTATTIATREERQAWWSKIMRGEPITMTVEGKKVTRPAPLSVQMKASELLGKSEGDFVKRVEVNHGGKVTIVRARIPDNGRSKTTPADAADALNAQPSTSPPKTPPT
jgi:antitoxin (DNA-binding transcriptional repressor) of toxin-antitoxin stability system